MRTAKNWAIELHDSTIAAVTTNATALIVQFRPAYLHNSDGIPGVDKGTGWLQDADLVVADGAFINRPEEFGDVSEGSLSVAEQILENCIPVPCNLQGRARFSAVLASTGEQLVIDGVSATIALIGEPKYLEQFA